ncbi:MAG: hypothetical protein JWN32_2866, partial [Solirubrobacterales bacterium]|nr:hypothetical protein [Solirubrobacterales bacterium]
MTSPIQRRRVAIFGDDRVVAQIIANGVPGYDVCRTSERCDLVHGLGSPVRFGGQDAAPLLVTAEAPAPGIVRWHPGVDLRRFNPGRARGHASMPGEVSVLHVGERADLAAEAVLAAQARDDRVSLVDAVPDEDDARAIALARADIVVAVDAPDRLVLEAQASGVAVLAAGGSDLVRDGRTGRECPRRPQAVAEAIVELAADAAE